MDQAAPFQKVQDRVDALLARSKPPADPVSLAEAALDDGEWLLESWLVAKGQTPTQDTIEGFRLLALHRQGARGDASFNACRETCRELVYLRNVVALHDDETEAAFHYLRLQAMVLRHLALFLGGKLQEAGLGDFCCASRPLHSVNPDSTSAPHRAAE